MLWLLFLLFFVGCVEGECPGEDLSLAPRPYTKPENLPVCEKPYRGPNCTCPSSMFECACHKFGRCGDKPGCFETWKVNRGINWCGDYSQEFADNCPADRFRCDCFNTTCRNKYGCVVGKCDLEIDCFDGSDEINCLYSLPEKFECACSKIKNCLLQPERIRKDQQCNGWNDCHDWSDEINCTYLDDRFECPCHKNKTCLFYSSIRKDQLCDGWNDCLDWSDEVNCTCPADHFECNCYQGGNCLFVGCLSKDLKCDGVSNCIDGSDEFNCTCPAHKFECPCYTTKNCSTAYGCITKPKQCDGKNDCGDWSDELNCICPVHKFECDCYKTKNCTTGYDCISKEKQCDKRNNCGDWSDEVNCTCPAHQFECACVGTKQCIGMEKSCINRSLLCDENRDCFDGSDETHYTCNCSSVYARCPCDPVNKHCPSTGRCIPFEWLGDGLEDCSDGSDELCSVSNFTCQSCTMFATTCKSKQLARYLVHSSVPAKCNTVVQPSCAEDINNCTTEKVVCVSTACKTPQTFCWDLLFCENQQVVNSINYCNTVINCNDTSDEIREGFGFKCSGSSRQGVCVLPQSNVYDSVAQCSDKSDLCFVNGQFKCFQCLDKMFIISPKQVCDGIADCFDKSDEHLCFINSVCNGKRGDCQFDQIHGQNKSVYSKLSNSSFQCGNQTTKKTLTNHKSYEQCVDEKGLGLDNFLKCTENNNKLLRFLFKRYVDNHEVEPQVLLNSICDGTVSAHLGLLGELGCTNTFYCFSKKGINIKSTQVCDGKVDCDDGSDEFLNLCHKTRYYCKTNGKVSIDRKTVCDGIIDCDNESDESRCRCEEERFFCTNKEPLSVEWKLVQNGIQDCSDGSDECVNLAGDAFADVNEMIANPIYRAIFWITALLAMGGNSFVFIATAQSLWKTERNQNVFINTSIFILNLSLADFLMGVYLFAIIIQATQVSGSYCLYDKEWRSSSLCSGLGALAIVSSEASAFTMTAMTTFRLVSAFKPFLIRSVRVGRIVLTELFCWISSIVLATIPLLQVTSEYFATDVWFPNNFFGTDFVSRENMSLLAERIGNAKLASWNDVKQTINVAFPRSSIKGDFGYYGKTSVCMPRLFATTGEFAWEYSTFLITINFLMFIYMVIAYVLIYKQSNRMKASRSTDVSSKMQKRISRLIVTDFCCWIPVCLTGYLSVGGIKMPPDAYVLSACLLLPINSALNPLLYSKAIEDQLIKAKKWIVEKLSSLRASTIRSSDLSVRYNARAKKESDRVIEIFGSNT